MKCSLLYPISVLLNYRMQSGIISLVESSGSIHPVQTSSGEPVAATAGATAHPPRHNTILFSHVFKARCMHRRYNVYFNTVKTFAKCLVFFPPCLFTSRIYIVGLRFILRFTMMLGIEENY